MEQGQENTCHMFTVSSDSEEYESALMGFKETMYGREFSIVNLKRIQNFNEYTKHCAFLDVLKRRYGGQVLLKRLFHGTSVHSVEAIAHQGFNRIFAADANGNTAPSGRVYVLSLHIDAVHGTLLLFVQLWHKPELCECVGYK